MKNKSILFAVIIGISTSCATVPKETVSLSKAIGSDLAVLQNSHREVIELYYGKIKEDIDTFIDEVYSPFIIHYVLKIELENYKKGEPSLFTSIENAGKIGGQAETDEALKTMLEFQDAANVQIQSKRKELLNPILKQEKEIIRNINHSYENVIHANSTLTAYLTSISKLKESQQEALSIAKLDGSDSLVTSSLVKVSELVTEAMAKGKKIDIKSDQAYSKMKEISDQIKQVTNKN